MRITLINKPRLEIQSTDDGVWLHFKTETGLSAGINLPVTYDKGGIIDRTITQFSKEYAANPQVSAITEMALCEVPNVFLHPNQLYNFVVMPGCKKCEELAKGGKVDR